MNRSTEQRIKQVARITLKEYEQGNNARCLKSIWRKFINPQFGICYRTYLNYMNTPIQIKECKE